MALSLGDFGFASRRAPAPVGRLPGRVVAAVRAQEASSEILIGWAQLAVVSIFATLYAVSPMADGSAIDAIRPVPIALGFYLLFTVVRLGLAYRRFMPAWFLYLSVIVDMSLLMGLMWSFHLQYAQPAAFYLKSPTLLYVFIFIGLRALRFDPRFVILAGLTAAAGWLAMLGYALTAEDGMERITRDYPAYLTGNLILLGAEFDKVISILLVTAILAVAVARARRLVVVSVREGQAATELKRFFAPEIARTITDAEQVTAGQGEARDAAILMIDLRGFTAMAATLPPHEVVRLLARYQAAMVPVIRRHGGTIDKFLGDGIMATFGAATVSDRYAADALRAVDDVMAAALAWTAAQQAAGGAKPLAVNAAVATGRVVFGAVGDHDRLEYTVIGDAVNLAAKLEKHNKHEGVRALTTVPAYVEALGQGYRPPEARQRRPGCRIAGMAEPLDLVVLAE